MTTNFACEIIRKKLPDWTVYYNLPGEIFIERKIGAVIACYRISMNSFYDSNNYDAKRFEEQFDKFWNDAMFDLTAYGVFKDERN